MKAILVTKDNKRLEIEITSPDIGVIVRHDTRKDPPTRVFNYVSQPHFSHRQSPEFHETNIEYIGTEGLPDDVWNDSLR